MKFSGSGFGVGTGLWAAAPSLMRRRRMPSAAVHRPSGCSPEVRWRPRQPLGQYQRGQLPRTRSSMAITPWRWREVELLTQCEAGCVVASCSGEPSPTTARWNSWRSRWLSASASFVVGAARVTPNRIAWRRRLRSVSLRGEPASPAGSTADLAGHRRRGGRRLTTGSPRARAPICAACSVATRVITDTAGWRSAGSVSAWSKASRVRWRRRATAPATCSNGRRKAAESRMPPAASSSGRGARDAAGAGPTEVASAEMAHDRSAQCHRQASNVLECLRYRPWFIGLARCVDRPYSASLRPRSGAASTYCSGLGCDL